MIDLAGVVVRRAATTVLEGVSLTVGAEVVALVGPSGSGKSTLLRVLLGLETPVSGTVRIADRILSEGTRMHVPPEDRRVAMVFQDLALWPHLTISGNLEYGLKVRGLAAARRRERIAEALSWVALRAHSERWPHELSGGERQRAAIARALVLDPVAVLLDEPLGNLDVMLKRELLATFAALFAERRLPVLYVTHDANEASQLAQRLVFLERGRVTQVGSWTEVERDPATEFVRAFTRHPRDGG